MKLTQIPQLVAATKCQVGENPVWHPDFKAVFFLDITAGKVYTYDPSTEKCEVFSQGPVTGGMTLQADGTLLLFQDGRISVLGPDGTQREVAWNLCRGNDRFNDVIADPQGRVFAGTMGGNGRLLRIDTDGKITEILDGLGVPNGMGFTPDCKRMYFTDSVPRHIYSFDYDCETGVLSNRRVFAEIPQEEGLPDGMSMDTEGFVWTAIWFGGRVKRYAPDGRLDREVCFPVAQTSAMAFGGSDLTDVYVTTAASSVADSMKPPGYNETLPRGGGLYGFRIEGLSGKPSFRSRINFGG